MGMNQKKLIIKNKMWVALMLTLLCNFAAYYGTRLVTTGRYHFNLTNRLEDIIPLVPWTVVIYFGCYAFWAINYVIGCAQEDDAAYRFISADFMAKIVCLVIFLIFPTTNTRPVIEGTGIFHDWMRALYAVDAADNLFPSIHCLTSWFCCIAVRNNSRIPKWYRIASHMITLAICISTLTTKQHVLIDVIGGVILAEGSYHFTNWSGFDKLYQRVLERIWIGRR